VARFLGIDLGTSFLKGAVLDLDAGRFHQVRRVPAPDPVPGLPELHHELDPGAVLTAVCRLITELLHDAPDATGLLMCSQMHGLVLSDERGAALSNVITWKDQRVLESSAEGSGTVFDELARLVPAQEQQQIGNELRVGVPATTLYWLRQRGRLPPGCLATPLPDFVFASLCGREPTSEPTTAAAHGLLRLDSLDWHHVLIDRLGLSSVRFPRVRQFGEPVGSADIAGTRLTCYTPVGDQQCALAGVGLEPGELSLNISTGSQVSELARDLRPGDFQVRPYFDGHWLRTIVQIPAGRALSRLVNLLTEIGRSPEPWAYVAAAVERVRVTDLDVSLAFFAADAGTRGHIANIHEGNLNVGHVFAAAFAWMAGQFAECAGRISPQRQWTRAVFSGGLAARLPRLRDDVIGRLGSPPVRLAPTEDDTLRGLLALALVCTGRAGSVADANRMLANESGPPDPAGRAGQS
jgi:sugar (pentulose or hexulose) kinase